MRHYWGSIKSLGRRVQLIALAAVTTVGTMGLATGTVSAYATNYYLEPVPNNGIDGSWNTGLRQGQQVIKHGDALYYADVGTGTVTKTVGSTKTVLAGRSSTSSTLHEATIGSAAVDAQLAPYGIEVGGDGTLYVAEASLHRVFKVDSNGLLQAAAGNGQTGAVQENPANASQTVFNAPNYIKFGPDDMMYISDANMIRRINADGSVTRVAGNPVGNYQGIVEGGSAIDQVLPSPVLENDPRSNIIEFDAQQRMYIASTSSVLRVEADNTLHIILKTTSATGFTREDEPISEKEFPVPITGFSIAPNGDMWLTITEYWGLQNDPYTYATLFRIHDGIVSAITGGISDNSKHLPGYGHQVNASYVAMPYATADGVYFVYGGLGGAVGYASVRIDTTPPMISPVFNSYPNSAGWHNSPTMMSWQITDPESAITDEQCEDGTLNTETAGTTLTCTATSSGGTASESVTARMDFTAPTLSAPVWTQNPKSIVETATLTVPAADILSGIDGAEYFIGDADPGQGSGASMMLTNVQNSGTTADLTASFGTDFVSGVYKVTVRARDVAGNWTPDTTTMLSVFTPTTGLKLVGKNKKDLIPSLGRGDIMPGLIDSDQTDSADYGLSVQYKNGAIDPKSDFQFSYKTGTNCNKPTAQNCHSFELNAASIAWMVMSGTNSSQGQIQGNANMNVDGVLTSNPFTVQAIDGNRLSPTQDDYVTLRVFAPGANPATDIPIYQASGYMNSGKSVEIK